MKKNKKQTNQLLVPLLVAIGLIVMIVVVVWGTMQMQQTQTRASKRAAVDDIELQLIEMQNELNIIESYDAADQIQDNEL